MKTRELRRQLPAAVVIVRVEHKHPVEGGTDLEPQLARRQLQGEARDVMHIRRDEYSAYTYMRCKFDGDT